MNGLSMRLDMSEAGLIDLWLSSLSRSRAARKVRGFLSRLRPVRTSWTETVLDKGRIALTRSQGRVRVRCLEGRALVTVEGDSRDKELFQGSSVLVQGGMVAVTAMGDACRVRLETV